MRACVSGCNCADLCVSSNLCCPPPTPLRQLPFAHYYVTTVDVGAFFFTINFFVLLNNSKKNRKSGMMREAVRTTGEKEEGKDDYDDKREVNSVSAYIILQSLVNLFRSVWYKNSCCQSYIIIKVKKKITDEITSSLYH